MAEESEGSEDLGDKFMPSSHKKAVAALLGIVVVVAAGVVYMNMNSTTPDSQNTPTQTQDNSSQQTSSKVGLSASQIEGEITTVTFNDIKAQPSSPTIAPEDGIKFVNKAGVDVQFTFDREIPNFKLAAGKSIIIDPTSIVYYDVKAQKEGAEFRQISARINVQS